jgi:hypothetical protein
MNTENINKREYTAPLIDRVLLDNEISLALESAPPAAPGEPGYLVKAPEYFNNDPFKDQLG